MSNRYKDTPVEDIKKYFRPSMAADGVVFALFDTDESDEKFYSGEAHVLLIKRDAKDRPDLGYWALPGGFVGSKETLEQAVIRELAEALLLGGRIVTLFCSHAFLLSCSVRPILS